MNLPKETQSSSASAASMPGSASSPAPSASAANSAPPSSASFERPSAEKMKKNAKNLLRLADRRGGVISVETLAEALEVIGVVNGYPSWQAALARSRGVDPAPALVDPAPAAPASSGWRPFGAGPLPRLSLDGSAFCAFDLSGLPLNNPDKLREAVEAAAEACALRWNMGLHRLRFAFVVDETGSNAPSDVSGFVLPDSDALAQALPEAAFLAGFRRQPRPLRVRAAFSVATSEELADEHDAFCAVLARFFPPLQGADDALFEALSAPLPEAEAPPLPDSAPQASLSTLSLSSPRPAVGGGLLFPNAARLHRAPGRSAAAPGAEPPSGLNWLHGLRAVIAKGKGFKAIADLDAYGSSAALLPAEPGALAKGFLSGLGAALAARAYPDALLSGDPIFLEPATDLPDAVAPRGDGFPLDPEWILASGFADPSGRRFPISFVPAAQTTWIRTFWARPGSGKSLLSCLLSLADIACDLQAGRPVLERRVEIGPASAGLAAVAEAALGAGSASVVRQTLENFRFNPFALLPGADALDPFRRALAVNFLTLAVTPLSEDAPENGMAGLCAAALDRAFERLAERPFPYRPGFCPSVDADLAELSLSPKTWREAGELLLLAGRSESARLAAGWASPSLSEIADAADDPEIRRLYGRTLISTGEACTLAFERRLAEARIHWRFVERETQPRPCPAFAAWDLDLLCKSGGPVATRQTAAVYLLHAIMACEDAGMFVKSARIRGLDAAPDIAAAWRGQETEALPSLTFDELHRASAAPVRGAIHMIVRESRAFGVRVGIASQCLDDSSEDFVEFSTSCFVEPSLFRELDRRCRGDLSEAAPELARASKNFGFGTWAAFHLGRFGKLSGACKISAAPELIWALSTTCEDARLREAATARASFKQACSFLAEKFPKGTCKPDCEAWLTASDLPRDAAFEAFVESVLAGLDAQSSDPE